MSDGITGKATYICENCGTKYFLDHEDFNFEVESSSQRGMGEEIQYAFELDEPCSHCDSEIHLKFEVWEYPIGMVNIINHESTGARILENNFEIYHAPSQEEPEEAVKLVKFLMLFRFDAFAEAFVDFWVRSYKKAPKPTFILSVVGVLVAIISLGATIYKSEQARIKKLERPESYAEQFELLRNTEKNLNELAEFILSQKGEIEATKAVIQDLETKRSELEPIVNANQRVVDAIWAQQRREVERTIWAERGISFGLGIFASLIASILWHFVGRYKKTESNQKI